MDTAIAMLSLLNFLLAVVLIVVSIARMDRRYAAQVRAEHDRKAILRGESER